MTNERDTNARRRNRAMNRLNSDISAIYTRLAAGRQINVLDIGKVFQAGRDASVAGEDVETAIRAAVERYTTIAV